MTQEMTASPAEMSELLETHQDGSSVSNKNLKVFCEKCSLTRELICCFLFPPILHKTSPHFMKRCVSQAPFATT